MDDSDVASIAERSPEALAILMVVNMSLLEPSDLAKETAWDEYVDFLTSAVGLPTNSAKNIVTFRAGQDADLGTDDDMVIGSLTTLDAIPYVGPICFATLLKYVKDQNMPAELESKCDQDADCGDLENIDCRWATLFGADLYYCAENDIRPAAAGPSFEAMARAFVKLLQDKDFAALNAYVHPDYGFFMLFNPGAMVVATAYTKFEDVTFFGAQSLADTPFPCEVQAGVLPTYRCEAELSEGTGWSKEGCYFNSSLPLGIMTTATFDENLTGVPVDEELMTKASFLDLMTSHGVYSTEAGFGVFFGMDTDGQWYITAIQAITWCDA